MAGVRVAIRCLGRLAIGPIVYRLGRYPFKVERRVRFPLGLLATTRRIPFGMYVQVFGAVAQFG